jgi:hypothetical protein
MKDNFEIKDDEISNRMRDIGDRIHTAIGETRHKGKMGFALFLFEFGEKGAMFYISDAQRGDMVKVLNEFIERQQKEVN